MQVHDSGIPQTFTESGRQSAMKMDEVVHSGPAFADAFRLELDIAAERIVRSLHAVPAEPALESSSWPVR